MLCIFILFLFLSLPLQPAQSKFHFSVWPCIMLLKMIGTLTKGALCFWLCSCSRSFCSRPMFEENVSVSLHTVCCCSLSLTDWLVAALLRHRLPSAACGTSKLPLWPQPWACVPCHSCTTFCWGGKETPPRPFFFSAERTYPSFSGPHSLCTSAFWRQGKLVFTK